MKRLLAALVLAASLGVVSASPAKATTNLTLVNGWSAYGGSNPAVSIADGVVQLSGGIYNSGTGSHEPFVLPPAFRPSAMVFVAADLCDAAKGRLLFQPNGVVRIQAAGAFSAAECFTSLEGVSFLKDSTGVTPLSLQNGWTNAPFNTRGPAVKQVNGVVRFSGAVSNGTEDAIFTNLPPAFRPAKAVVVPITLCDAEKGRLVIGSDGDVGLQSELSAGPAQCMSSLEGASFIRNGDVTSLTLANGWVGNAAGTRAAGVKIIDSVVHFRGAVASGSSEVIATVPPAFVPSTFVYLGIDLCGGYKGRLTVASDGTVTVSVESGDFSLAQCFTSLDGASYDL